jgi:hypothetical protein
MKYPNMLIRVRCPAIHRADLITFPNPRALFRVEVYFEVAKLA